MKFDEVYRTLNEKKLKIPKDVLSQIETVFKDSLSEMSEIISDNLHDITFDDMMDVGSDLANDLNTGFAAFTKKYK